MKKTYLLDTNIVSEFVKERPDEQVINFYNTRKDLCAISSVTWQEIIRGVSKMPEGKRKNTLKSFVNDLDLNMEVITFDKFSAQICGEIQAAAEKNIRFSISLYGIGIKNKGVAYLMRSAHSSCIGRYCHPAK